MHGRFVSYLRVSTDKQGRSGLGLEAQCETVATFLNGGSWQLVGEFVEVKAITGRLGGPRRGSEGVEARERPAMQRHPGTASPA